VARVLGKQALPTDSLIRERAGSEG
jgi:hypothetical protein